VGSLGVTYTRCSANFYDPVIPAGPAKRARESAELARSRVPLTTDPASATRILTDDACKSTGTGGLVLTHNVPDNRPEPAVRSTAGEGPCSSGG
jgi:hypothetical protein